MRTPRFVSSIALYLSTVLVGCGGGGGGGGPTSPVPANVPSGTGRTAIQMQGTWQLGGVTIIDSNTMSLTPPADGTALVIGPTALLSIGGLSVARPDLEALLGMPLDAYVNQLDGRTIFYGIVADSRPTNGSREQGAIAGGSVDANTISVEGFISSQAATSATAAFVRWRGTLARTSPAIVLPEPTTADGERPRRTVRDVFGSR